MNAVQTVNIYAAAGTTTTTGSLVASFSSTGLAVTGALSSTTGANFATSSGNVGIGTAGPGVKLDVVGNIRTSLGVMVKGSGLTAAASQITFDQLNTSVSRVVSWGPDTSTAGSLSFWTLSSNATVGAERLRITSAGNVGIGTTGPTDMLSVKGNVQFGKTPSIGSYGLIGASFNGADPSTSGYAATIDLFRPISTWGNEGELRFSTNPGGAGVGSLTQRMVIDKSGNVGIGTTSPGSKLDVNGELRIGNTVNTVTPTSPDRTITMVIGGTTYYIHAKTTND
jgi:hypothetical protein